jgi:hypothetical protein
MRYNLYSTRLPFTIHLLALLESSSCFCKKHLTWGEPDNSLFCLGSGRALRRPEGGKMEKNGTYFELAVCDIRVEAGHGICWSALPAMAP